MSSTSLDLDINNYNINDIARVLQLDVRQNYIRSQVEARVKEVRDEIMRTSEIKNDYKTQLVRFFDEIKEIFIFAKCREDAPATIISAISPDRVHYPISTEPPPREGELVPRRINDFVYTQNSEYFTGTINPLDKRTIKKCLTIDSNFRENYYSTKSQDFVVSLPTRLNKVVSMQLNSFEFPASFYNISASYGNNYLNMSVTFQDLSYNRGVRTTSATIVVPDGNYNAVDLISTINQEVSAYSASNSDSGLAYIFKYIRLLVDLNAANSGSGKVTVTRSLNDGATNTDREYHDSIQDITLDFTLDSAKVSSGNTNLSTKIGWNLGFTRPKYSGATTYLSDTAINPYTIRYFYLSINDYNNNVNNNFITMGNTNFLNSYIMARVSVKNGAYSLYNANMGACDLYSEPRRYFGPVDINKLHIQIYDDRGRLLDLNNSNYSFSLVFELMYDL